MQIIDNNNERVLTKVFNDRTTAEPAYQAALDLGYKKDDINVVMSDDTRTKYFMNQDLPASSSNLASRAVEGMGVGSAVGGAVGALMGVVAAVGTALTIPGLGLVIAGPLAAGLAGAGAGGMTGGFIGALVGYGMTEKAAQEYESAVKKGAIVISVHTHSQGDYEAVHHRWKNSAENKTTVNL